MGRRVSSVTLPEASLTADFDFADGEIGIHEADAGRVADQTQQVVVDVGDDGESILAG